MNYCWDRYWFRQSGYCLLRVSDDVSGDDWRDSQQLGIDRLSSLMTEDSNSQFFAVTETIGPSLGNGHGVESNVVDHRFAPQFVNKQRSIRRQSLPSSTALKGMWTAMKSYTFTLWARMEQLYTWGQNERFLRSWLDNLKNTEFFPKILSTFYPTSYRLVTIHLIEIRTNILKSAL